MFFDRAFNKENLNSTLFTFATDVDAENKEKMNVDTLNTLKINQLLATILPQYFPDTLTPLNLIFETKFVLTSKITIYSGNV